MSGQIFLYNFMWSLKSRCVNTAEGFCMMNIDLLQLLKCVKLLVLGCLIHGHSQFKSYIYIYSVKMFLNWHYCQGK